MTIIMGIAVHPNEGKPYALMVADSRSTMVVYNPDDGQILEHRINEDIQKLHKFENNLIIGFEGELREDVHHKVIESLGGIIEPTDDLYQINKKVAEEIKNTFPDTPSLNAHYSVLMAGFIDGIPSINRTRFLNADVIENRYHKPSKGSFSTVFDDKVPIEKAENFLSNVRYFNNITAFRKALVELAKETAELDMGSNDNIKVERLR